ncbi:hypothetical protein ACHAXN_002426 [Cyclotella atomus]
MTSQYSSFQNTSSAASVSSASHSTDISNRYYSSGRGGRDQQIFRRAGSDEPQQQQHGGNEGFRGKLKGTQWQQPQQHKKQNQSAFDKAMNSNRSGVGVMDWPDSSTFRAQNVPQQQLRPQSLSPNNTSFPARNNSSVNSRTLSTNARQSPLFSNNASPNTNNPSRANNNSITNMQPTTSSQSTQSKSTASRVGVVTKLVSLFSNKSSQESVSTGASATKQSKSSSPMVRQNNSQNVQFQNVDKLHNSQFNNNNQSHNIQSNQFNNNNPSTQSNNQKPHSPNSYPPISPSRSNITHQSSVSGESSYNPTGWPGTVDKRGKTYQMEASYSEEESYSGGTSGNNGGTTTAYSPRNRMMQTTQGFDDRQHTYFPTQQYRQQYPTNTSFDGGDSQAELQDWIHGNSSTCDSVSKSGPVDLDYAYEQRSDWREQSSRYHQQHSPLGNISENHARTAADFHLEAALKTNPNNTDGLQSRQQNHLTRPYPLNQGRTTLQVTDVHSPSSITSSLDEESIQRGIDTSFSESRVRASGRHVLSATTAATTATVPMQQRRVYDDEVDFGECDEVGFDEYSPDEMIHSRSNYNKYDDEVDFNCPNDLAHQPRIIQPPTEEALRLNNSMSAPPRPGGALSLKGYRGFIDKTRDVPNLMDDLESEANTSLGTNAERRALGLSLTPSSKQPVRGGGTHALLPPRPSSVVSSNVDSGSDVFEGIAGSSVPSITSSAVSGPRLAAAVTNNLSRGPRSFVSEYESFDVKQTINPFRNQQRNNARQVSSNLDRKVDFVDPELNLSAVSKGSAGEFSHHDILDLDDFVDDVFDGPDLSIYCVPPESVRLMVRAFRKMCTMQMEISSCEDTMLSEFEDLVDTKKRFALFEMRSRIMETDIDRGLERRGGTNVVDDIVLTPYFQAMHRVRDAVIVSKAWRDGATPKDVVTAHLLTRRSAKAHFVRRPVQRIRRPGAPSYPQYWLEERTWLDETDFSMMKCQSLGAGTMKGFEMFTIGDCQSILLKMTSENCTQLRRELRSAMMCQIEAEEVMQEEIDLDGDQFVVAEAEQLYRDATVEVKSLSMKLVLADKAFSLVRSRMEKLVETIESLLIHLEDGEAPDEASSSDESENENEFVDEERERTKLVERAKRAEMSAEIAIRETLLAKQEAEKIKSEKQREIDDLKNKLAEMETQSQHMASRYSSFMAGSSYLDKIDAKSILEGSFDRDMEDARQAARDRAKLKFRERRAIGSPSRQPDQSNPPAKSQNNHGEEIYQRLDFYSRSLNSVQRTNS